MRYLLLSLAGGLFGFWFVADCEAEELVLAKEGEPLARIVIGDKASPEEKYAAQELRRVFQLMSGAELMISQERLAGAPAIIIGTPGSVEEIREANLFTTGNEEEIRVSRKGNDLFLAGSTPRAALQASYTFLQDEIGARWLWPGASGEYLPLKKSISIGDIDVRQVPSIMSRKLSINSPHYDEETATWMARNRMNSHNVQTTLDHQLLVQRGLPIMIGGHNLILPKALLEKHPEYIAEYGGKRQYPEGVHPPHLCWSNKNVQDEVVAMIRGWWRNNPDVSSISFFGADHNHFCECSACTAMEPDVSTRWQSFSEKIIGRLDAEFPRKNYQSLAYQAYRDVPRKVARYDLIGYATYNIDYTKPLGHPANEEARREIIAWQKAGGRMGIRGYQFIPFNEPIYSPSASVIAAEIKWASENGLFGWDSEITPYNWPRNSPLQSRNWISNRLSVYMAARVMWDANVDVRAVVSDWHRTIFGEAWAPMNDLYLLMDDAWTSSDKRLSYFLAEPAGFVDHFISDGLLEKADGLIMEARKRAASIKEESQRNRVREQIKMEEEMLNSWRRLLRLKQGRGARFHVEIPKTDVADPMSRRDWQGAAKLPGFEDGKRNEDGENTDVWSTWDEKNLYLKFILHDSNDQVVPASRLSRDADSPQEDVIEVLLESPSDLNVTRIFAVSSGGDRSDALLGDNQVPDKSWDPEWSFRTAKTADGWMVEMALPLTTSDGRIEEVRQWKAAFKRRSSGGRIITGWPDSSYRNRATFGDLQLVDKLSRTKNVLLYEADVEHGILKTNLAKNGFTVSMAADQEQLGDLLSNGTDVLLLRRSGKWSLDGEFLASKVRRYLDDGGLLILSSYGDIPLDQWFGPTAGVKWTGWEIDANRVTISSLPGPWQNKPQPLESVFKRGIAPASGYFDPGSHWQSLANLKVKDGRTGAYLLRQKIGKGTLILTSSDLSYGGGHEMFGNGHSGNAVKLIENLLQAERE